MFTVEELDRFLSARGSGTPNTRRSLLTYYRKKGRIIPIRRGLYASVPVGGDPISSPVDPYLVAAKLTPDAVLAYLSGVDLRVTSLERTLVDVLDRPDLSGSWEEIWRSLESIEFFDLDQVITYALLLGNATTAAKVGFFWISIKR